jgi:hypothetical protein
MLEVRDTSSPNLLLASPIVCFPSQLTLVILGTLASFFLAACFVRSTQQPSLVGRVLDAVRGSSRLSACGAASTESSQHTYLGKAQSKCQVIGRTGCILTRRPGSLPPADEAAPGLVQEIRALQSVRPWPNTPYFVSMPSSTSFPILHLPACICSYATRRIPLPHPFATHLVAMLACR